MAFLCSREALPSTGVRGCHSNKASDSQWGAAEGGGGGTSWSGTSPYHHPHYHHHQHHHHCGTAAAAADLHHHLSHHNPSHHHHYGQEPTYAYCLDQPTPCPQGNSVISLSSSSHQHSRRHNCQECFQAVDPVWAGLGWAGSEVGWASPCCFPSVETTVWFFC
ncbi:unnamed protein product [Merluccius merluccius]